MPDPEPGWGWGAPAPRWLRSLGAAVSCGASGLAAVAMIAGSIVGVLGTIAVLVYLAIR